MNIKDANLKLGMLVTVAIGAILLISFYSVAMANPDGHCDAMQMNAEKMHVYIKSRLDKLAGRLEIKSSQQAAWDDFSKSVETLAEWHAKEPKDDADAAAVLRYRAERATEFAKRLTVIADASVQLETALTDDQKKTFNQVSRSFLHEHHGWRHQNHGPGIAGH